MSGTTTPPLTKAQQDLINADNDIKSRHPEYGGATYVNNPFSRGVSMRPRIRAIFAVSNSIPLTTAQQELVASQADIASRHPQLAQQNDSPGIASATITNNSHHQADQFSIDICVLPSGVGSLKWWSQQKNVPIDIQMGWLADGQSEGQVSNWKSMLQGYVDKFSFSPRSQFIKISGRDLSAKFIDTPTGKLNVNQTSSEIVQSICSAHSIACDVSPTTTRVGRFWADGHSSIGQSQHSSMRTDWDVIAALASLEGFDAYMRGGTLVFAPKPDKSTTPYGWFHNIDQAGRSWGNVDNLSIERDFTVSKGVQVTVKSWNSKQNRTIIKTSPASQPSGVKSEDIVKKNYVKPNMTEDQAQKFADARYADLSKNEITISAHVVPDLIFSTRNIVSLFGTGTDFDQLYYPSSITRTITASIFTMQASCKNKMDDDGATTN
jgi:phage protein D